MPKSSTTTSTIHQLFARAMSTPVVIKLPSKSAALTLRHRLYSARKSLRARGQASKANLVELVIRPEPTPENPEAHNLIARPLDYDFDEALAEALSIGIQDSSSPEEEDSDSPSITDILKGH